jgi:hypothetical protein
MPNLTDTAIADQFLEFISDCLGLLPTSTRAGKHSQVITWDGLTGDTVLFARSARAWDDVAMQIEAALEGRWPAAVIAARGSGNASFVKRDAG